MKTYLISKWADAGFQKYFRSMSWMFIARIISLAASFVSVLYIARILGPENFGELSYAQGIIGIIGIFIGLGIDGILYRDILKYPDKEATIFGTAWTIRIITGFIAIVGIFVFSNQLGPSQVSQWLIILLSTTYIFSGFYSLAFLFQGKSQTKELSLITIFINILLALLKIVLVTTGSGILILGVVLIVEQILFSASYVILYYKKFEGNLFFWNFDKNYAKELLKNSIPLVLMSASALIYERIDQVLIRHLLDAESVGIYAAAVRLTDVWMFIPGTITVALYPAIVNAKITSSLLYKKRIFKLLFFFIFIALSIASTLTLLAPFIVTLLFGDEFIRSIPVLQIYIWSLIPAFISIITIQIAMTENWRIILSTITIPPMLLNVALNFLWIPTYGVTGAAYATVISYSLSIFMPLLYKRIRQFILAQ